jgi:AraC family transcriptional regulator
MSEEGVLAALPWGTGAGSVNNRALAAGSENPNILSPVGSPSQRILHLVRRALVVLESDCQAARRCLDDAVALLGPHPGEGTGDDAVARGVFEPGGLARWQARRAVAYIDGHLESRLDVPLLAKLVSFSKSHFSRAFKQSLGLPPMAYVKMRRIERAKVLIISTNQQLTEIALICGFADQSHLNRSFRRVIGMSPGRWRRTCVHMAGKARGASEGSAPPGTSAGLIARHEPAIHERGGY